MNRSYLSASLHANHIFDDGHVEAILHGKAAAYYTYLVKHHREPDPNEIKPRLPSAYDDDDGFCIEDIERMQKRPRVDFQLLDDQTENGESDLEGPLPTLVTEEDLDAPPILMPEEDLDATPILMLEVDLDAPPTEVDEEDGGVGGGDGDNDDGGDDDGGHVQEYCGRDPENFFWPE